MQLTTAAQTFGQVFANGNVYAVPPFQREYSWDLDQVRDLWIDLRRLDESAGEHFLGPVVIQEKGNQRFELIDGQQRFATLSLLVLAAVERLLVLAKQGVDSERNERRAEILRRMFLGDRDAASLTYRSKLQLNRTDDNFYQDRLLQLMEPGRKLPQSHERLRQTFGFFRQELTKLDDPESGERIARLIEVSAGQHLSFIVIKVDNELSAYTLFETLNARGVDLGPADLIKNYLYSRVAASDTDLDRLDREWRALVGVTGQKDLPGFLRHFFCLRHRQVRQAEVFRLVKNEYEGAPGAFRFVEELTGPAQLFGALRRSGDEYWLSFDKAPEIRRSVDALSLFRVTQVYPVLFAAAQRFPDRMASVLRLLEVISFRHTVVASLSTSDLEPVYNEAAQAIMDRRVEGPKQLFESLRPLYVTDERFREYFQVLAYPPRGQKKNLVKYILLELERRAGGRIADAEDATIEHIEPQSSQAEFGDRLGNLTLLEGNLNRTAGSRPYREKREIYQGSRFQLTSQLHQLDEWTESQARIRQTRLAELAVQVWRVDF